MLDGSLTWCRQYASSMPAACGGGGFHSAAPGPAPAGALAPRSSRLCCRHHLQRAASSNIAVSRQARRSALPRLRCGWRPLFALRRARQRGAWEGHAGAESGARVPPPVGRQLACTTRRRRALRPLPARAAATPSIRKSVRLMIRRRREHQLRAFPVVVTGRLPSGRQQQLRLVPPPRQVLRRAAPLQHAAQNAPRAPGRRTLPHPPRPRMRGEARPRRLQPTARRAPPRWPRAPPRRRRTPRASPSLRRRARRPPP